MPWGHNTSKLDHMLRSSPWLRLLWRLPSLRWRSNTYKQQWNKWSPIRSQYTQYRSTYCARWVPCQSGKGQSYITNSLVCSTQQKGVFFVSGNPKHSPQSGYQIFISQGQCSCAYFTLKKIPCKYVFVISLSNMGMVSFTYVADWSLIHDTWWDHTFYIGQRGYNRWQRCTLRLKWDTQS